jgi:hypothetical protein
LLTEACNLSSSDGSVFSGFPKSEIMQWRASQSAHLGIVAEALG